MLDEKHNAGVFPKYVWFKESQSFLLYEVPAKSNLSSWSVWHSSFKTWAVVLDLLSFSN